MLKLMIYFAQNKTITDYNVDDTNNYAFKWIRRVSEKSISILLFQKQIIFI